MKNDEQLFFKIDDYLKGRLTPEEAAAFRQQIAADPELAQAVELQRFGREGLEYVLEKDLREKMKTWKKGPAQDEQKTPPNTRNGNRNLWLGLLALALLVTVAFFMFRPIKELAVPGVSPIERPQESPGDSIQADPAPTQPSQNQLPVAEEKKQPAQPAQVQYAALSASEYELPENLSSGLRSDAVNSGQSELTPAVKAFKSSPPDYKTAIVELKKITRQSHPAVYDQAQEMLAHAYFNTKQYAEAARIFEEMTRQGLTSSAHDQAEWYLLLSLLPDYERQQAKIDALLEKMSEPEHEQTENAAEVKRKLERLKTKK